MHVYFEYRARRNGEWQAASSKQQTGFDLPGNMKRPAGQRWPRTMNWLQNQ